MQNPSRADLNLADNVNNSSTPIKQTLKINKKLTILHQNIQHFLSRKPSLEIVLDEIKPDVAILSEHSLNSLEMIYTKLNNYSVKSFYCREQFKGGGVMIMCRDSIYYI